MDSYDAAEDLPSSLRPRRGVTVALLVMLTVVLAGVVGVFVYALSSRADPAVGAMPPPGSGRDLVYELVPVLDDDAAIAAFVPASEAVERVRLRADCGQLTGQDPDITVLDGATPSSFRLVLEGTSESTAGMSCWIRFKWVEGEGWHATSITH